METTMAWYWFLKWSQKHAYFSISKYAYRLVCLGWKWTSGKRGQFLSSHYHTWVCISSEDLWEKESLPIMLYLYTYFGAQFFCLLFFFAEIEFVSIESLCPTSQSSNQNTKNKCAWTLLRLGWDWIKSHMGHGICLIFA